MSVSIVTYTMVKHVTGAAAAAVVQNCTRPMSLSTYVNGSLLMFAGHGFFQGFCVL